MKSRKSVLAAASFHRSSSCRQRSNGCNRDESRITTAAFLVTLLLLALPSWAAADESPFFEVSLGGKSKAAGIATVYVEQWRALSEDKDVTKSHLKPALTYPGGPLSLAAFSPIEKGDALAIMEKWTSNNATKFGEDIGLWKTGNPKPVSGYRGFFVGCEGDLLTIENCYRMKGVRIVFKFFDKPTYEKVTNNSGNLVFLLSGGLKTRDDVKGPPFFAATILSSEEKVAMEQRIDASNQAKDHAARDAKENEKGAKERENERYRLEHDQAIKKIQDLPIGTTVFCTNSGKSLLTRGDLITNISYKCDIAAENQRFLIRELLENGLDIVSETQTTVDAVFGVGNVVSLRLKRVKGN